MARNARSLSMDRDEHNHSLSEDYVHMELVTTDIMGLTSQDKAAR